MWAFISFKIFLSAPNIFLKKEHVIFKMGKYFAKPKIWPLRWPEKWDPWVLLFKISFLTQTPRKHLREIIKLIHGHQKANKSSQNPKSTRNKNYS